MFEFTFSLQFSISNFLKLLLLIGIIISFNFILNFFLQLSFIELLLHTLQNPLHNFYSLLFFNSDFLLFFLNYGIIYSIDILLAFMKLVDCINFLLHLHTLLQLTIVMVDFFQPLNFRIFYILLFFQIIVLICK